MAHDRNRGNRKGAGPGDDERRSGADDNGEIEVILEADDFVPGDAADEGGEEEIDFVEGTEDATPMEGVPIVDVAALANRRAHREVSEGVPQSPADYQADPNAAFVPPTPPAHGRRGRPAAGEVAPDNDEELTFEPEDEHDHSEPDVDEPMPADEDADVAALLEAELEPEPEPAPAAPAPVEPAVPAPAQPAASALVLDLLPLRQRPPAGPTSWLADYAAFKDLAGRLAARGDWTELAAMTGHAVVHAPYATGVARVALLGDLARIFRDRLHDEARAEQAFAALAELDPGNAEALGYLRDVYERRGAWEDVYWLCRHAVTATWDPHARLAWTREAARTAGERLQTPQLAIEAWERLWQLGDAQDEAALELSRAYRASNRWAAMAAFLREQAQRASGPVRGLVLRELAVVERFGNRDAAAARAVLDDILRTNPDDPVAALQIAAVLAETGDFAALAGLARRAASDAALLPTRVDLWRLAADSLWAAGQLDEAMAVGDLLLGVDPHDEATLSRKREYLVRRARHGELLSFLEDQARAATTPAERADFWRQAARLASDELGDAYRAATLWEQRSQLLPDDRESYEALARLYEQLADPGALALALEGLVRLTPEVASRLDLLARLGRHYAGTLKDDNAAERCWKQILRLDPRNLAVRDELIRLHERRGDFEALNSSLLRQIWLTNDEERARHLCRLAAENLDNHFEDVDRSIEAWLRFADFAPNDGSALDALAMHYELAGRRTALIDAFERQLRATVDLDQRIRLALRVAALWEQEDRLAAATATYERVLRWAPTQPDALDALLRLYRQQGQPGKAAGVIEHAAALADRPEARVALLRRRLEWLEPADTRARFFLLRRILRLGDDPAVVLGELKAVAEADPTLWPEVAAILAERATEAVGEATRHALCAELASVYADKLAAPHRAYLAVQSVLFVPEPPPAEVLDSLVRLADATGRHEDLLAVLQGLTGPAVPLDTRREALRRRAALCEQGLGDPLRAFQEYQRILDLDPSDGEAQSALDRLAEQHGLWPQLEAVLTEQWDRNPSTVERAALVERLEAIARERLPNAAEAFDRLLQWFRLSEPTPERLASLESFAARLDGWSWWLPLWEAAELARETTPSRDALVTLADRAADKSGDAQRAFFLLTDAFAREPQAAELRARLEALAERTGTAERLAEVYRAAAARSSDPVDTADLLRRVAALYEQAVGQPAKAIDVHRRLLRLQPGELRSLDVMIDWHRNHAEWRDLRDRLAQWVQHAAEPDRQVARLIEMAQLSQRYLDEPEGALDAYGHILQLDPSHEEARAGLSVLEGTMTEPRLRVRWLQMQARLAPAAETVELRLEIARLQAEVLKDVDEAAATLRHIVDERGPDGPGFAPLADLLRSHGRSVALIELLRLRAESLADPAARLATLDEALTVSETALGDGETALRESLYRYALQLRPSDDAVRARLEQILRNAGRYEELLALLEERLDHTSEPPARAELLHELARLAALNLGQRDRADGYWRRILAEVPNDQGALLGLARSAWLQGDLDGYLDLRQKQADGLPAPEAAHALCHLAEVCDETPRLQARLIGLYRRARTVDPENVPAMEALKGIGRRLKNLRPAAALLPEAGERELTPEARARRLVEIGNGLLAHDLRGAIDAYRRATAIAPDDPDSWKALSNALRRAGAVAEAFAALRSEWQARQRTEPSHPKMLGTEAKRLHALALAAREAHETEAFQQLVLRAAELDPGNIDAVLSLADVLQARGQYDAARDRLTALIEGQADALAEAQRLAAYCSRGQVLLRLGLPAEAERDFARVLDVDPLHPDALVALGGLHEAQGRPVAAIDAWVRALTRIEAPAQRMTLYGRIGATWEDRLGKPELAGAWYERAIAEGTSDRELLRRAVSHFLRSGRDSEALALIENLLPGAQDADELAALWLLRGQVLATREGAESQAIEAFDMALSYDPNRQEARDGLVQVLERSADYEQVVQVLEAVVEQGAPDQRAAALQRLARIAAEQLHDPVRAERYLQEMMRIRPNREGLEQLLAVYGDDASRLTERREALGMLVSFGPPWFSRCAELARILVPDERRWAWCLLAPLTGVSRLDAESKAVLQELRSEFERPPVLAPSDDDYPRLFAPDPHEALTGLLVELDLALRSPEPAALDRLTAAGCTPISDASSLGKTFRTVATLMDMPGALLLKAPQWPEAVSVIDTGGEPTVVFRGDVVHQAIKAEAQFLFAYGLELARPGHRVLAVLPPAARERFVPALCAAVGLPTDGDPDTQALAEHIVAVTDPVSRQSWAETLRGLTHDTSPADLSRSLWALTQRTALRAGLLANADLRQAFRAVARLAEDVPKPKVVSQVDELDDFVAPCAELREIVAFAASPQFGALVRSARSADDA